MGVPKFFRWISERYPKINQPIHAPPNPETQANYFPAYHATTNSSVIENNDMTLDEAESAHKNGNGGNSRLHAKLQQDHKVYIQKNSIIPEFDRLYIDMNGIIHCSSHNNASDDNATIDPDTHIENNSSAAEAVNANSDVTKQHDQKQNQNQGTVQITEAEIFRNVCYYVDRVVSDIAKPKELVYMAIDGVAPRAKMNQQRSRRYRSGKEKEIESTFYGAHLLAKKKEEEEMEKMNMMDNDYWDIQGVGGLEDTSLSSTTKFNSKPSSEIPSRNLSKEKPVIELDGKNLNTKKQNRGNLEEVEPGRYTGTFQTSKDADATIGIQAESNPFDLDYEAFLQTLQTEGLNIDNYSSTSSHFHSNEITPGTPFFERCTAHLQHFIQRKLHTDPRWKDLTIIFSGPNVPGEGEHKIMDFIRRQKTRPEYNPNTTHCMFGQDGDLIMLGLATHEPHFALLREEVVFDQSRKREQQKMAEKKAQLLREKLLAKNGELNGGIGVEEGASEKVSASIDSYIHNSNFELLHMSILRDYLAYEFETREVLPNSPFELEKTIDDFVFMTFIVGNDFLPHMPAIDIADEAFDLLFYTYKRNRWKWLKEEKGKNSNGKAEPHPYLTNAGDIVSGRRLERFFTDLGKHEDPYYDNKKQSEQEEMKRMRKSDKKAGRETSVPSDEILAAKEEWDRTNYMEMLMSISESSPQTVEGFKPVSSSKELFADFGAETKEKHQKEYKFQPDSNEELDEGFLNRMGALFRNSLSTANEDGSRSTSLDADGFNIDKHISDLKGRYYYEKFNFSPLDAEKHIALRKAYIEGLVWNLQYYYKGCASWDWFYPYHYGPRLSDLRDIDSMLKEISFDNDSSEPLKPFEQLMACLPPSSADLLPKPYQWLMKSSKSPLKDFYPESFTIDMNGKRWPWEAVVLLPFIDSERLIQTSRTMVSEKLLSEDEKRRNQLGDALVFARDKNVRNTIQALSDRPNFGVIEDCAVASTAYEETRWRDEHLKSSAVLKPQLLPGVTIPFPGFPTLRDAPVHGLNRRKLGINVFGMRSRYRTAVLELDREIPMINSAEAIAGKFIGTTLYFRYPFLQEGFVTAVSDAEVTVRGKELARKWTETESKTWKLKNETIKRQYETGEGLTGSGGWNVPESDVTLSIRPLKEIQTLSDGSKVKVYARLEVEVPMAAAMWSPSKPDPRFTNIPARLEKNPYRFGSQPSNTIHLKTGRRSLRKPLSRSDSIRPVTKILPDLSSITRPKSSILGPNSNKKAGLLGSSSNFSSITSSSLRNIHKRKTHTLSSPALTMKKMSHQRNGSRGLALFATIAAACLTKAANASIQGNGLNRNIPGFTVTESAFEHDSDFSSYEASNRSSDSDVPALEFAHGTTTLSFIFDGGIVAAVDSRASIGNFVGSKTTQKVLPITNYMLGTMAGGAADCSFWIRKLQAEARHFELTEGRPIAVSKVSRLLADYLYANRHSDLSVGTMIMGYDDVGPSIYYVDNKGTRIVGDMFSVGSGSTFALGVLDTERRSDMDEEEAIALGIKAIRHATFRDAYSGGFIAVYVINKKGWRKVFSEDLALSGDTMEYN